MSAFLDDIHPGPRTRGFADDLQEETMSTVTITTPGRRFGVRPGLPLFSNIPRLAPKAGVETRVEIHGVPGMPDGRYHFDRLDDEPVGRWQASYFVPAGASFPRYCMGAGSRSTIPVLAPPELAAVLEADAEARRLWAIEREEQEA